MDSTTSSNNSASNAGTQITFSSAKQTAQPEKSLHHNKRSYILSQLLKDVHAEISSLESYKLLDDDKRAILIQEEFSQVLHDFSQEAQKTHNLKQLLSQLDDSMKDSHIARPTLDNATKAKSYIDAISLRAKNILSERSNEYHDDSELNSQICANVKNPDVTNSKNFSLWYIRIQKDLIDLKKMCSENQFDILKYLKKARSLYKGNNIDFVNVPSEVLEILSSKTIEDKCIEHYSRVMNYLSLCALISGQTVDVIKFLSTSPSKYRDTTDIARFLIPSDVTIPSHCTISLGDLKHLLETAAVIDRFLASCSDKPQYLQNFSHFFSLFIALQPNEQCIIRSIKEKLTMLENISTVVDIGVFASNIVTFPNQCIKTFKSFSKIRISATQDDEMLSILQDLDVNYVVAMHFFLLPISNSRDLEKLFIFLQESVNFEKPANISWEKNNYKIDVAIHVSQYLNTFIEESYTHNLNSAYDYSIIENTRSRGETKDTLLSVFGRFHENHIKKLDELQDGLKQQLNELGLCMLSALSVYRISGRAKQHIISATTGMFTLTTEAILKQRDEEQKAKAEAEQKAKEEEEKAKADSLPLLSDLSAVKLQLVGIMRKHSNLSSASEEKSESHISGVTDRVLKQCMNVVSEWPLNFFITDTADYATSPTLDNQNKGTPLNNITASQSGDDDYVQVAPSLSSLPNDEMLQTYEIVD